MALPRQPPAGDRHHYVAQFHLRGFLDPASRDTRDPWLWTANCLHGEIRKRAPRNLGWERGLYDVPGAQSAPNAKLETLLAERVEGPAAEALREYTARPLGARGPFPPDVMLYVAWAASRTPAMRSLYQQWLDDIANRGTVIEPPPKWLTEATDRVRLHHMEHPTLGRRDVPAAEVEMLRSEGWRFIITREDFGELLHVQAHYLAHRHFPRLNWFILNAPKDGEFIIGDRPVVWGFEGSLNVTPAALRHPEVQVVAPLTATIALMAVGPGGTVPGRITPQDVNLAIACAAEEWIAGTSKVAMLAGLKLRRDGKPLVVK